MAYLPREERRAAITDATLQILRRDGFAAVSARSVAEEVGGSPGLIHQHFSSVTELVISAWQQYVAENVAEFESATLEGADPLREFYGNHLEPAQDAELGLWADAWAHAMRAPEFAETFAESVEVLVEVLARKMMVDGARQVHEAEVSSAAAKPGRDGAPEPPRDRAMQCEITARRAVVFALGVAGLKRVSPVHFSEDVAHAVIDV